MRPRRKPNLLLLMTDQQRWDTIRAAGNANIKTPNLDRLCATGVRFNHGYSESPECVPARAMVLTGKWGHETGCLMNTCPLDPSALTFPGILKSHGYETQAIGKMHFHPARSPMGFDHLMLSEEIPLSLEEDDYLSYLQGTPFNQVHEPHGLRHEYYYLPQVSQLPDACHNTTWVGDRTVHFLKERAQSPQPWLLFSSFIKPHPPFDATIPYITQYNHELLPLPVRGQGDRDGQWELHQWQTSSKWMEEPNDYLSRLIKANYYACITQIDTQIGRIIDTLEESGMRENTLILFTSDHGEMLGDHYQWGKRSFYNGSTRIPYILSMPGTVEEGIVRDDLAGHLDIAPTMLGMAGIDHRDYGLQGIDLLSGKQPPREVAFGEYGTGERMLFMAWDGRWKYIYTPNGRREALFDLVRDPQELTNLAEAAAFQSDRGRLRAALCRFLKDGQYTEALTEDAADLAGHDPVKLPLWRNRQYAAWTDVPEFGKYEDIYRP